jgi:hypothetical protein
MVVVYSFWQYLGRLQMIGFCACLQSGSYIGNTLSRLGVPVDKAFFHPAFYKAYLLAWRYEWRYVNSTCQHVPDNKKPAKPDNLRVFVLR